MNCRVLATSIAATAGLIAFGLGQAYREPPKQTAERLTTVDIAEPMRADFAPFMDLPPPDMPGGTADFEPGESAVIAELAESAGIAVGVPKIAYRFAYGFRLPEAAIKPLQERHADMCEARGSRRCRIVSMEQAENEGDYTSGSLELAVASGEARAFGKELVAISGRADGELVSSSIDGEDLSKQIVDTRARLGARTVLRDRLLEVLRKREGTVKELVEAERGVAQVNEEIDEARSWLAEMTNRVAYSQMHLTYESGAPSTGGFVEPIRSAWASLGGIFGGIVAALITLIAVLAPLGLLVLILAWLWRRSGIGRRLGGWLPPRESAAGA